MGYVFYQAFVIVTSVKTFGNIAFFHILHFKGLAV